MVKAGDVCLMKPGEGHGIINNSKDEDLIILDIIYRVNDPPSAGIFVIH